MQARAGWVPRVRIAIRRRRTGLWANTSFLKLWAGQTVSLAGSQVSLMAIPLTAVLTLGATPAQMGLLRALEMAPHLVVGLFAGVWVDRVRRRPVMIAADLGRAALLASIPAAAALGLLRVEQLYVVGLAAGTLHLFYLVAYSSYLPALVERERLVEANSRLQTSYSATQTIGPGLAGALVQLVTAPFAIVVDVLSFLCSASLLAVNRAREPAPPPRAAGTTVPGDVRDGLRSVWDDRSLRALVGATTTFNLFGGVMGAVYLLYVTQSLGIRPAELGMITAAGGAGGIAGSMLAVRAARRLGLGRAMIASLLLAALSSALIPVAGALPGGVAPFLAGREVVFGVAVGVLVVNLAGLVQTITPARMLGRLTATRTVTSGGALTLGALAGGTLGDSAGLAPALWVGACGVLLSVPWLLVSPVRRLSAVPPAQQSCSDGNDDMTAEGRVSLDD